MHASKKNPVILLRFQLINPASHILQVRQKRMHCAAKHISACSCTPLSIKVHETGAEARTLLQNFRHFQVDEMSQQRKKKSPFIDERCNLIAKVQTYRSSARRERYRFHAVQEKLLALPK